MTKSKVIYLAKKVEGFYANDDVMILLDALLKQSNKEREKTKDKQDIIKNNDGTYRDIMILSPLETTGEEEQVNSLIKDIDRAITKNVEQILLPINIYNHHWVTVQLIINYEATKNHIQLIIHDSLGTYKSLEILAELKTRLKDRYNIADPQEGNLKCIQKGTGNLYCGGYTARLIFHLANKLNNWGDGEEKEDDSLLRNGDVAIVNQHNIANSHKFGIPIDDAIEGKLSLPSKLSEELKRLWATITNDFDKDLQTLFKTVCDQNYAEKANKAIAIKAFLKAKNVLEDPKYKNFLKLFFRKDDGFEDNAVDLLYLLTTRDEEARNTAQSDQLAASSSVIVENYGDSRPGFSGTYFQALYLMKEAWKIWETDNKEATLRTEVPGYGKFDDIVYEDGEQLIVTQAKYCHKEEGIYVFNDWVKPTGHKISLSRYYDSWAHISNTKLNNEIKNIQFRLVSNYKLSDKDGVDKNFAACIDLQTKKFKIDFIESRLQAELLKQVKESFFEYSLTIRKVVLTPQLKKIRIPKSDNFDGYYNELLENIKKTIDNNNYIIQINKDCHWSFLLLLYLNNNGKLTSETQFITSLKTDLINDKYSNNLAKIEFQNIPHFNLNLFKTQLLNFLKNREYIRDDIELKLVENEDPLLLSLSYIINKLGSIGNFLNEKTSKIENLYISILSDIAKPEERLSENEYKMLFFEEIKESVNFASLEDVQSSCVDYLSKFQSNEVNLDGNAPGAKKTKLTTWRDKIFSIIAHKNDNYILCEEFFTTSPDTELGKFREAWISKLKNKDFNLLRNIKFINIPEKLKKQIEKKDKEIILKPRLYDDDAVNAEISKYLKQIELHLNDANIEDIKTELKKKIGNYFNTVESLPFNELVVALLDWFRKESEQHPLSFDKIKELLSTKTTPEYQRSHLVAYTISHENLIYGLGNELIKIIMSNQYDILSSFINNSEKQFLLLVGESGVGKSELVKTFFRNSNYKHGRYLFLNSDNFDITHHIPAISAPGFEVLILDKADKLISSEQVKLKTIHESISVNKKKLVLISNHNKEGIDDYEQIELKAVDFNQYPDHIKNLKIDYKDNQVKLRDLHHNLLSMLGNVGFLTRTLQNKQICIFLNDEDHNFEYIPQGGIHKLKIYSIIDVINAFKSKKFNKGIIIQSGIKSIENLKTQFQQNNDINIDEITKDTDVKDKDKFYYIDIESTLYQPSYHEMYNIILLTSDNKLNLNDKIKFYLTADNYLYSAAYLPFLQHRSFKEKKCPQILKSLIEHLAQTEKPQRILVESPAGMGKSRLAQELAKSEKTWAVLIYIQKLSDIFAQNSIEELLWNLSDLKNKKGIDKELFLIAVQKQSLLLIVDGLDELSINNKLLTQLNLIFSYPYFIALSRYEGIRPFESTANFIIDPFTNTEVKKFIRSSIKNKENQDKVIKKYTDYAKELLQIPILCKMFCEIAIDNIDSLITLNYAKLYSLSNMLKMKQFLAREGMKTELLESNRILRRTVEERDFLEKVAILQSGFLVQEYSINLKNSFHQYIDDSFELLKNDIGTLAIAIPVDNKKLQFLHQTWQEYYTALCIVRILTNSADSSSEFQEIINVIGLYSISPNFENIGRFVMELSEGTFIDCKNSVIAKDKFIKVLNQVEELNGNAISLIRNGRDRSTEQSKKRIDNKKDVISNDLNNEDSIDEAEIGVDDLIKKIGNKPPKKYWEDQNYKNIFYKYITKLYKKILSTEEKNKIAEALIAHKSAKSWDIIESSSKVIYLHRLKDKNNKNYNTIKSMLKEYDAYLKKENKYQNTYRFSVIKDAVAIAQEENLSIRDMISKYVDMLEYAVLQGLFHKAEAINELIENITPNKSWYHRNLCISIAVKLTLEEPDKNIIDKVINKLAIEISQSTDPTPKINALEAVFKIFTVHRNILNIQDNINNIFLSLQDSKSNRLDLIIKSLLENIDKADLLLDHGIIQQLCILFGSSDLENAVIGESLSLYEQRLPIALYEIAKRVIINVENRYEYFLLINRLGIKIQEIFKDNNDQNEEISQKFISFISENTSIERCTEITQSLLFLLKEDKCLEKISNKINSFSNKKEALKNYVNGIAEVFSSAKVIKLLLDIGKANPNDNIFEIIFDFTKESNTNFALYNNKVIVADAIEIFTVDNSLELDKLKELFNNRNLRRIEKILLEQNIFEVILFKTIISKLKLAIKLGTQFSAHPIENMSNNKVIGDIKLLPEVNHNLGHNINVHNLIRLIDNSIIKSDTAICIERKQFGNNLGMNDVVLIANALAMQNKGDFKLLGQLQNILILNDALLYNAAKAKYISVIGIEGKGLRYSKESPYYHQAREEYMAEQLLSIARTGKNAIFLVGGAHINNLIKLLRAQGFIVDNSEASLGQKLITLKSDQTIFTQELAFPKISTDLVGVTNYEYRSETNLQPEMKAFEHQATQSYSFFSYIHEFAEQLDINWQFEKLHHLSDIWKYETIKAKYGISASFDIFRGSNSNFRKSVLLKLHPDKNPGKQDCNDDFIFVTNLREEISKPFNVQKYVNEKFQAIQPIIYKTNLGFKALDTVIDATRLVYVPTIDNAKKILIDTTYLYNMYSGVNGFSTIINGADVAYKIYQGEYSQALTQALTTALYMLVPAALSFIAIPYFGFMYGVTLTIYSGYGAINNAYSFYQEYYEKNFGLKSITVYKNLFESLSNSPLQYTYDFISKAKEYEIKLNNIKLEQEKTYIKERLEEKGEFGQKLYEYIYSPIIKEKYKLQNKIVQGILTGDEANNLKAKYIQIMDYDYCMEVISLKEDKFDHYYCYNEEQQILDHIMIIGEAYVEKISSL